MPVAYARALETHMHDDDAELARLDAELTILQAGFGDLLALLAKHRPVLPPALIAGMDAIRAAVLGRHT